MFTGNVIGDVFHRPRAIQCHHRDDILKPVRFQAPQYIAHAAGFQLEDTNRVTARQHREGFFILKRDIIQCQGNAATGDQLQRLLQHGQGFQPEEIKFHQPGVFNPFHVELGHRHVRARITVERHQLRQGAVTDHQPGSVGGGMAIQPLQLTGNADHARRCLITVTLTPQLRLVCKGLT